MPPKKTPAKKKAAPRKPKPKLVKFENCREGGVSVTRYINPEFVSLIEPHKRSVADCYVYVSGKAVHVVMPVDEVMEKLYG